MPQVEIGQYREVNKGAWKATFTLLIHPDGLSVIDCRYFVAGDRRWFSFPQKQKYNKDSAAKPEYFPFVRFLNKEYEKNLQISVLQALKSVSPEAPNVKAQNYQVNQQTYPVQDDASFGLGDLPF